MRSFFTFIPVLFFSANIALASETVKGVKSDFAKFKSEMSARLGEIEKELEVLKKKTTEKGGEAKETTVKELEETKEKLKTEVGELQQDSKDTWKEFKEKLSSGLESLHAKIQKALKD